MSKGLVKEDLNIPSVLTYGGKRFLNKFVMKYQDEIPEVAEAHQGSDFWSVNFISSSLVHYLAKQFKNGHALSNLQAKAEYEIDRAQKIILSKNEELHVVEEGLSGLKEVQIEYWGNGHTLEVSGNFNGWHHPIEMEPNSSSTMGSIESRRRPGAKIPKSRVMEKHFWTHFHLSQFSTRWGRSVITLGGCQSPGSEINLDVLVYEPPRDSPTLWEIGIKKHMVKTRIYRFMQYGLWERYAELYPDDDFIFKIGINDYHKDWLFAQVPRKKLETDGYEGTTWQIIFKLDKINKKGTYKLLSYELRLHLPLLLNCRFE
ncbi:hypothetical protein GIB67_009242 [Kingdonia uniflora]|uniref:Rhamnogalacturonan lyase domain-containing protein n=1 Tax=Kingdonia uniflora TaxID=39325 RepID=A0A7J7N2K2_9MAGN|nr:hypothetical protein GIB67_009242 [Kingdonia uniflora]